jgi:spermidine/putrescine-binding protein
MKKIVTSMASIICSMFLITACGNKGDLYVYNWGEYMDPEVIEMFEEETGLKVVYDEYETNEIMYPKVSRGTSSYDLICPSDYMIQRMREEDLLAEINLDNVPNMKNIGEEYLTASKEFDPENKFSIPYFWGTVGILYNKSMVDGPIDSWDVIFDEKYKDVYADDVLMQNSVRDALGIALKYLGYSLNTTNEDELNEARDLLIGQLNNGVVQAYVVDEVRDKMIGDAAAIGVIYSGEALYTISRNQNLEYVIPKEGSNIWIDSWVIMKDSKNKENAERFLDFLCRPDIALMNFEYITYSTPNTEARALIEDEAVRYNPIVFPDASDLEKCETYRYLGPEVDELYNEKWKEVKSAN